MQKKIALVYLGRRGGGARLLRDLTIVWTRSGHAVTSFIRNGSEFSEDLQGTISSNLILEHSWKLFFPWIKNLVCEKLVNQIEENGFQYVIFIMSHPWTPTLLKKLKKRGIRTFVLIHDDRPHKGEVWPTKRHIRKEVQLADIPVFLSNFVANKFPEVIEAGIFNLDALPLVAPKKKVNRILIAGRIKKYKGISQIYPYLLAIPPKYEIMFAGKGFLRLPNRFKDRVKLLNFWIPADKFETLIMQSSHVFLPYIEATQSGIISIAKLYDCHIITTDVGGLRNQLQDYKYWSILPLNPEDFAFSLEQRLVKETNSDNSNPSIFELINKY
jgi:glycosyltransferase involved in cell wall biosynthesis